MQRYMLFVLVLVSLIFLISCENEQNTIAQTATTEPQEGAEEGTVQAAEVFVHATYASSSKLQLQWKAIEGATSYLIQYKENSDTSSSTNQAVSAQETSTIIPNLKSGTTYDFEVFACVDSTCTSSQSLGTTTAATEEEYWQIQGTGNGFETATQIVKSGSVLSYAVISPATGKINLYYNPFFSGENKDQSEIKGGVAIATLSSGESVVEGETFDVQEEYGLQHPCFDMGKTTDSCGTEILTNIKASQVLPLASGVVRIFFEAEGQDGHTRIMSIDSADGLVGLDFNTGEETSCATTEDYDTSCVPTVRIGVVGDATRESSLVQARQFKIGYPKQESWLWDEIEGTFMVITGQDTCGTSEDGLFYALFDGEEWNVEEDGNGCAIPVVKNGHGPVVVDLSRNVYKLYYEDEHLFSTDKSVAKPLKLLYGNTQNTGDLEIMEITDWETAEKARDIHFLWPDNSEVSDENEAGFGDHYIYFPTGDPTVQIMYLNLGGFDDSAWKQGSFGLGMARLVNP